MFFVNADILCMVYGCRALARNCCATIDDKKGATAKQWKEGKPVRVVRSPDLSCDTHLTGSHGDVLQVRNHKGRKTSDYAPEEGNRYDGIYKVSLQHFPLDNNIHFFFC